LTIGVILTAIYLSPMFPIVRPILEVVKKRRRMTEMRRLLVVATVVAVLTSGGAFAGEVKGPPGTPNNTNETGALDHANSACAASGLNDLDEHEGQNVSQVQTAADSWKYYGLPKGAPGTLGLCKG
jgi:hypothetical protein